MRRNERPHLPPPTTTKEARINSMHPNDLTIGDEYLFVLLVAHGGLHHDHHRRTDVEQEQRSSSRFRFMQTWRIVVKDCMMLDDANNAPQSFDSFHFYSDEPLI